MKTKWHKEVLEALGMMASKDRIINKLNPASVKSDDPKLRELASQLILEVKRANSNTRASPARDLVNGVPTAKMAISYCESIAHPSVQH